MELVRGQPYDEAVAKLGSRSVVAAVLNSADWSGVPVALRERAFFSSRVESARFLQRGKDALGDYLAGARDPETGALKTGSRAAFVQQMQRFALAEGMGPLKPGDRGTLKDITSQARLGLIFDIQTRAARDFGNWKQGMDPAVLDEFPAQRFIRVRRVKKPRPYHERALGLVRLKTDLKFWISLNPDFGVPWGPWGYGSGCDVEDVDRAAAEKQGLLKRDKRVRPVDKDFNDGLKASTAGLDPEILKALAQSLGERAVIDGDVLRWRGKKSPAPVPEPEPAPEPKPVPEPAPAPEPEPVPKPTPLPAPESERVAPRKPATLEDALKGIGIEDAARPATGEDMRRLVEALREADPIRATDRVASFDDSLLRSARVPFTAFYEELAKDKVLEHAQGFMDLIPRAVADKLPPIHWVIDGTRGQGGSYDFRRQTLTLSAASLMGESAGEVKRVVWHELMHWLHFHGTAEYRQAIADHFKARTTLPSGKMEPIKQLPLYAKGTVGQRDDWYEQYAGRRYAPPADYPRSGYGMGTEVPTRYVELLLKDPDVLAHLYWNNPRQRETLLVIMQAFFG